LIINKTSVEGSVRKQVLKEREVPSDSQLDSPDASRFRAFPVPTAKTESHEEETADKPADRAVNDLHRFP
jgi:hypothetical protein